MLISMVKYSNVGHGSWLIMEVEDWESTSRKVKRVKESKKVRERGRVKKRQSDRNSRTESNREMKGIK